MPTNFNQFTTGSVPANTEHVVGFNNTSSGGERKWTLQTLSVAVSGIMNNQLNNLISSSGGIGSVFSDESSAVTTSYVGDGTEVLIITLNSTPTATNAVHHLSLTFDQATGRNSYIAVYRNKGTATEKLYTFPEGSLGRYSFFDYTTTAGPHQYTVYFYGDPSIYLQPGTVTISNMVLSMLTIY
jgi:hypothetical protein